MRQLLDEPATTKPTRPVSASRAKPPSITPATAAAHVTAAKSMSRPSAVADSADLMMTANRPASKTAALTGPSRRLSMSSGAVRVSSSASRSNPQAVQESNLLLASSAQPCVAPSTASITSSGHAAVSRKILEPEAPTSSCVSVDLEPCHSSSGSSTSTSASSSSMTAPVKVAIRQSIMSAASTAGLEGPKRVARSIPQPPSSTQTLALDTSSRAIPSLEPVRREKTDHLVRSPTNKPCADKEAPTVVSLDELKALSEDSHWENRVNSLDLLNARLQLLQQVVSDTSGERVFSASQASGLEVLLDILVSRIDDAHHKVTSEALSALEVCIHSFPGLTASKLPLFLPALFQR